MAEETGGVSFYQGLSIALAVLALGMALLMAAPSLWAQGLRACLDRDRVYEGDTVTLTIEADGWQPDSDHQRPSTGLYPLERHPGTQAHGHYPDPGD